LKHSPVVFAKVDTDLRYEWIFNPHDDFAPDAVRGRRDDELDSGPGIDAIVALKQRALDTGEQLREEITFERSDGPKTYDITATPIRKGDRVVGLMTASLDVTTRKELENDLRRLNETLEERVEARAEQVQRLASRLTMVEQRERDRLARTLHDDLQQLLYSIQVQSRMITSDVDNHPDVELSDLSVDVEAYNDLFAQAIQATRELTVDLSPPVLEKDGLMEALQWLRSYMDEQRGFRVVLSGSAPDMDPEVQMMLFHVARELVFNAEEHAGVAEAEVRVHTDPESGLCLEVVDEGEGFESDRHLQQKKVGVGLGNVAERLDFFGGHLSIDAAPGEGTHCRVVLPEERLRIGGHPGTSLDREGGDVGN
jgi:signal transduction histidine kinase